jgi:flagellar assembly factor FliW
LVPRLKTRDFGEIDYSEDSVIEFPHGLPAFENERRFLMIQPPSMAPLIFLQSAQTPSIAFTAVPVATVEPGYDVSVLPEDLEAIGCPSPDQVAAFVILAFSDEGPATANLLAPIIVNAASRRAVQAVRSDSRYSHRHAIGGVPCS